jgi:transposase
MPPSHRAVAGITEESLRHQAMAIGPRTEELVDRLLQQRRHPQQAFRSCLGVLRLAQQFGIERLEAACIRALKYNAVSWKSLQSILKNGLDQLSLAEADHVLKLPEHENLRGASYYKTSQNLH